MDFGIFCNQQRGRADVTGSWDEDVAEIVAADRAGFQEAWISEHTGSSWLPDALPSPDLMICKLAGLTQSIRFGPAIRRLALYHPLQVAIETAVCDHLTGGRYMFGFGRGGPVSGWGQRGTEWEQTHSMMVEGIELMLRCFEEPEPFDYAGEFYRGQAITVYPKPVQLPHPPIAVATGNPVLIRMAAERGFRLMTSQFATPREVRRLGEAFDEATGVAGKGRAALTAVRGVFLADSDAEALRVVRGDWERHIAFNQEHFGVNYAAWTRAGQSVADVTFDSLLEDGLMFIGSPATVADRIDRFYDECGGFGTFLLVTGRDWGSLADRTRSLELFAEHVAPRLRDRSPLLVAA
jgi:alkanesulfonate monooxygenase SsuD/methylene tetrahydromethanopterin reductase-like flavin-dependent oxidoreductase (luciferase family)